MPTSHKDMIGKYYFSKITNGFNMLNNGIVSGSDFLNFETNVQVLPLWFIFLVGTSTYGLRVNGTLIDDFIKSGESEN